MIVWFWTAFIIQLIVSLFVLVVGVVLMSDYKSSNKPARVESRYNAGEGKRVLVDIPASYSKGWLRGRKYVRRAAIGVLTSPLAFITWLLAIPVFGFLACRWIYKNAFGKLE